MKSEAARALDLTDTKSILAVQGVGREMAWGQSQVKNTSLSCDAILMAVVRSLRSGAWRLQERLATKAIDRLIASR